MWKIRITQPRRYGLFRRIESRFAGHFFDEIFVALLDNLPPQLESRRHFRALQREIVRKNTKVPDRLESGQMLVLFSYPLLDQGCDPRMGDHFFGVSKLQPFPP